MRRTILLAVEALAAALFPAITLGVLGLMLRYALPAWPAPFLAAEVLPWLTLLAALPIGLTLLIFGTAAVRLMRERRETADQVEQLFSGRR